MTFALISLIVFAILVFLKFCEDSPVRSWRMVVIAGVFLSLTISYYFNHAFPKPGPRQSPAERIAVNRAELQRDFRHMAGVKAVRIDDRRIEFDLAGNQPANELKSFALQAAGTAAYFLQANKTNPVVVLVSVNGRNRYALTYAPGAGIVDETTY